MKTVREVMTADVIRLSPTNKIKTAIILMKGHNIGGLPVLEGDQVVGVLHYQDVLGKDNEILVQNVMDREFVTIPADMPVTDAANLMTRTGSSRLLVMAGSGLTGVVTRGDVLPELGKSFDPITGLPRADAMRDWGIDALKRGAEITVIFIDLDRFGQFNKKYGHITGDKILKHVAQVLRDNVDEERDMLCRYAGDEFVILTTRNTDEAKDLADVVDSRINATPPPELPEPVTGSIGRHGGKRTKEREHVHYEATLDNLINLASRSCTLAKGPSQVPPQPDGAQESAPEAAPEVEPTPETTPEPAPTQILVRDDLLVGQPRRLRIQSLNLFWGSGSTATAEVELTSGQNSCKHSRTGFALGSNALRLVAEATAGAVADALEATDRDLVVESVNVVRGSIGEDVVLVTALLATPQSQMRLSGSSIVRQDAYRATAAALLNAVNRQISTLITA